MILQKDKAVIICRWQCGAYGLKEMIKLVKKNIITKEQFFDITRYNYDGVTENNEY